MEYMSFPPIPQEKAEKMGARKSAAKEKMHRAEAAAFACRRDRFDGID